MITCRSAKTPKGALPPEEQEITVPIASDRDIFTARRHGRTLALQLGYSPTEATLIATVISELARNIVRSAKHGEIELTVAKDAGRQGIMVVARGAGPWLADVPRAVAWGPFHFG